jgi:hypothetical protein
VDSHVGARALVAHHLLPEGSTSSSRNICHQPAYAYQQQLSAVLRCTTTDTSVVASNTRTSSVYNQGIWSVELPMEVFSEVGIAWTWRVGVYHHLRMYTMHDQ